VEVNGKDLIEPHRYEQMPATSQYDEMIYVRRVTNKHHFKLTVGFRSRCEPDGRSTAKRAVASVDSW